MLRAEVRHGNDLDACLEHGDLAQGSEPDSPVVAGGDLRPFGVTPDVVELGGQVSKVEAARVVRGEKRLIRDEVDRDLRAAGLVRPAVEEVRRDEQRCVQLQRGQGRSR